jgi:mono/diheme cytochrome c family protein
VEAILFIAFWIILGAGLVFIALRGGPRRARASLYNQSRRSNRVAFLLILAAYIGLGIAVPTLVLAGNKNDDQVTSESITLTAAQEHGRALFGQRCNQCHTLAAAKTVGQTGPNFNELRPTYPLIVDAVVNGRNRGNGTMPAKLVEGGDVSDVACFVDRATHPSDPVPKQCRGASASSGSSGTGARSGGSSPEN